MVEPATVVVVEVAGTVAVGVLEGVDDEEGVAVLVAEGLGVEGVEEGVRVGVVVLWVRVARR